MGKDRSERTFHFPLTVDLEHAKIIKKKVLEIDPTRIKAGEILIVQVPQWGGIRNQVFAVMNVGGTTILIEQLDGDRKKKVIQKMRKK